MLNNYVILLTNAYLLDFCPKQKKPWSKSCKMEDMNSLSLSQALRTAVSFYPIKIKR